MLFGAVLCLSLAKSALAGFDRDPATIKSCTGWYDNDGSKTCKETRDYFSITPQQFAEWNPSVGVDCGTWHQWASYCITTKERDDEWNKSHPPTTATPTSSEEPFSFTTTPIGPSPPAWTGLGCYNDNYSGFHIMEKLVSDIKGDGQLTIPKCQDACYKAGFKYVGVMAGNQCWCSSYVAGEITKDEKACNLPCSGDPKTVCGGKDVIFVYEPLESGGSDDVTTAMASLTSTKAPGATSLSTSRHDSKAARNNLVFY